MFRTMFTKGAIPVLERVVSWTEQRQNVIAGNVANVDTPFYRARDLDQGQFRRSLRDAIERRRTGNPRRFEMDGARNVRIGPDGEVRGVPIALEDGARGPFRHDQNDVSIEREMVKMAQNALQHQGAVNLLVKQFKMMQAAIRGRPD